MPGIDTVAYLGATLWTNADGAAIAYARQRARFDTTFVSSLLATNADISAGNDQVRALVEADEQTRGWLTVHPGHPELCQEEMRKHLVSHKFIGSMLATNQVLDSEPTRDLLNALRRYGKPICLRVENARQVRELAAIAPEFNTLRFIAAGAGGDDWQDCMLVARSITNIYLEPFTGGAHAGKLAAILQVLKSQRVVFATGFPLQNPGIALGLLSDADIPETDRQTILSRSAPRIFEI